MFLYGDNLLNMKKILGMLALTLTFIACDNDVVFNDPSFGAQRLTELNDSISLPTYEYWKATDFSAKVLDGSMIITGTDGHTTIELRTVSYEYGSKYDMGVLEADRATLTYKNEDGEVIAPVYITNGEYGVGSGYITYSPKEKQVEGTISGEFNITFVHDMLEVEGAFVRRDNTQTYNKGTFYRIPVEQAK
ncbi:hypothetical protein SAMN04487893_11053 [Myroides guanonis]|uniref:Uncharacterized protein n=2 Tax=Myroides guanonis TaxID=1150112 RepID=A0A1I3SDX0_9FLAO|nr:hypothetical protein SAMN04487893_11053 [Myroides guanonis]